MTSLFDRRAFVRTITAATACLTLPHRLFSATKKSLLVFTKSSGFEHEVVKRKDGKLSICETVVTELGKRELGWTPDRVFSAFPVCSHPEGHV